MPPPHVDVEATEPKSTVPISSASSAGSKSGDGAAHLEQADGERRPSVAALLRNPLAGRTEEDVLAEVDVWVEEKGLQDSREAFRKGALLARVQQRDDGFESVSTLSEDEKGLLRHEFSHRWSQPFMLYFLVILCAGSAIVQGMDQTAVNGAQVRR